MSLFAGRDRPAGQWRFCAPDIGREGCCRGSFQYLYSRNIDNPLPAGFLESLFLCHDFLAMIPTKQHCIVWIVPRELFMTFDWNMHARAVFALLDRRSVADKFDQFRCDAAVVENGRAF